MGRELRDDCEDGEDGEDAGWLGEEFAPLVKPAAKLTQWAKDRRHDGLAASVCQTTRRG